jgi:tripartite-type tricarboxylate transporter receptor subunit TctC
MKKLIKAATKLAFALTFTMTAFSAQADQPIRLLVGFAPGGTTDIIARLVAQKMSTRLGKSIIVENRPGASGNIAAALVAKSAGDGSTMLFAPSSHATNATLYSNLQFDTEKDFSAVGLVATTPYVLVVNPSLPVRTVPELIQYLKANPEKIAYASASPGTAQHLAAELFKKTAGVDMLHVPYKGSAAALADLASGLTPVMFDNIAVVLPHIKSGTVRPLAVTSTKRSPLLPDLPTIAESGLPGFEMSGWFTLLAPRKTDPALVKKFNEALNATVNEAAFKQKLNEMGAETLTSTPEKTDAFIKNEIGKWRTVIQNAKIAVN